MALAVHHGPVHPGGEAVLKLLVKLPALPLLYATSAAYWFVASRIIERRLSLHAR